MARLSATHLSLTREGRYVIGLVEPAELRPNRRDHTGIRQLPNAAL
jgi:hypothetical protein